MSLNLLFGHRSHLPKEPLNSNGNVEKKLGHRQAEASDKKALLYCKQQQEEETVRGGERAGEGTGEAGFRGVAELAGADNGTERGGRL